MYIYIYIYFYIYIYIYIETVPGRHLGRDSGQWARDPGQWARASTGPGLGASSVASAWRQSLFGLIQNCNSAARRQQMFGDDAGKNKGPSIARARHRIMARAIYLSPLIPKGYNNKYSLIQIKFVYVLVSPSRVYG